MWGRLEFIVRMSNVIEIHCKDGTKKELGKLKDKFFEYWKIITGIDVMKSDTKRIEDSTFKKSVICLDELKAIIRNIKKQLNEL